ncbi:hypothetical protein RI367_001261 [Sorochytrium milnesiophthora]
MSRPRPPELITQMPSSSVLNSLGSLAELLHPAPPPPDRLHAARLIFFVQGLGMLFPWNALISAPGFFQQKFRGSPFDIKFESYFSVGFMITSFFGLAVTLLPAVKRRGTLITNLAYAVNAAVFVCLLALTKMDLSPDAAFGFVMALVLICGFATALMQSHLFGLAGCFPGHYTQSLMIGQAISGLAITVSNLALQVAAGSNGEDNIDQTSTAVSYFAISLAVVLFSLVMFIALLRLPIYDHYVCGALPTRPSTPSVLIGDSAAASLASNQSASAQLAGLASSSVLNRTSGEHRRASPIEEKMALPEDMPPSPVLAAQQQLGWRAWWSGLSSSSVGKTMRLLARTGHLPAIICNFAVTLALFPSLLSLLAPSQHGTQPISPLYRTIYPSIIFVLYNGFDVVGRSLPALPRCGHYHKRRVIVMYCLRLLFVPLFMLSQTAAPKRAYLPTVITSDGVVLFLVVLFAVSSGYLGGVIMMDAPSTVLRDTGSQDDLNITSRADERQIVGRVMSFSLMLGMILGSVLSLLVVDITLVQ